MAHANEKIQHVSDTALWVAYHRAAESERADALFHDPFARKLVGERGSAIAESMKATAQYTSWVLAIRTYVIDHMLERLLAEGVDLVLNLGAGLDTRPYRMNLPASLIWVEVDYPHMIEHKEKLLAGDQPRCLLERVKLDLADREKRQLFLGQMAARGKKILVLTEGVILYLEEKHVAELADDLHAHPSLKLWIAEYVAPASYVYLKSPKRQERMRRSPFLFFPADWFGLFKAHGWVAREVEYLGETSHKLGRPMPAPWWAFFLKFVASKQRIAAYRRFMGYVIFERL